MSIEGGVVTITRSNLYENVATIDGGGAISIGGDLWGGDDSGSAGVNMSDLLQVTISHTNIYDNAASQAGGVLCGGGFGYLKVLMHDSTVHSNFADSGYGGINGGGGFAIFDSCQLTLLRVNVTENQAVKAGGLAILGGDLQVDTTVISGNKAMSQGGGILISNGKAIMTKTLVTGNSALQAANVASFGGELSFQLPVIAGYWLPNANCMVFREGCSAFRLDWARQQCEGAATPCSLVSGVGPTYRPTISYQSHRFGTVSFQCMKATFVQPCNWQTRACETGDAEKCLLGKKVYTTPSMLTEDRTRILYMHTLEDQTYSTLSNSLVVLNVSSLLHRTCSHEHQRHLPLCVLRRRSRLFRCELPGLSSMRWPVSGRKLLPRACNG